MQKTNKGVSLISLSLAIALMMLIAGVLIYNAININEMNKLNNMYNDIEILQDRISVYYNEYNDIPAIKTTTYTSTQLGIPEDKLNPNDNNVYYEIDLPAIDNLTINYGRKVQNSNDVYVVNEQSHTVYYKLGITVDSETYYTMQEEYTEVNYGVMEPVLGELAGKATTKYVTWDSSNNIIESTSKPSNWYDYEEGRWANIKTEANGQSAYWVWIPRYEYKIPVSNSAQTIDIKFIPNTQTIADAGYTIHPAFWWDENNNGIEDSGEQLAGIWVAKFEASSSNPSATNGGGDVTTLQVRILPSVASWRGITSKNAFAVCRAIEASGGTLGTDNPSNLDSHIMKNMEWGAVAILSQSKYGKYINGTNEQVWNNPNSNFITGNAATSLGADAISITACDAYNIGNGPQASTTGNVYGVYDMAGGSTEYVAGVIEGTSLEKLGTSESKYFDSYKNELTDRGYNNSKNGDAIKETAGWNNDYDHFIYSTRDVLKRGGSAIETVGTKLGIFAFAHDTGDAANYLGFRPVLAIW